MGDPYLKQWLNVSICLSKEIKDISEDFRNGYLFGEILHKHKLIPNFHLYKNSTKHKDISKNYQYLSKAFDDLNIKFSDTRRNDILNKKPGVASQIIFKLKQIIDQKLLSKENLKMQQGPNELHNLYKQMVYPNNNEKYFKDLLNRRALKDKRKILSPITQFLSKEGKFYVDIGKEIEKDKLFLDNKSKSMYNDIHNLEDNRSNYCNDKDKEGLQNWKKQMDIKNKFDKDQLKEKWKETEFYKTATFRSFKKSNISNINEISRFSDNLSRLGLDVTDQNINSDQPTPKKNYMSPQIILKMFRDKIAEQEKSRKDKEKRMRKIKREEDKMIELSKNNKTKTFFKTKKLLIESKDKENQNSEEAKFMTLKEMEKKCLIDDYDKKKKEYENTLNLHKKEKILNLPKEENKDEKITLPYKSMLDFFDKNLFFMRLDKLNMDFLKKKMKKNKIKFEKNIPGIKNIFEKILEITEESDNYLQNHNCDLIEIPQWEKWMQLLKNDISITDYLSEKEDSNKIEKKSVELLYENEDEEKMVQFKFNEFFDYLNFMGEWNFNIKEKILEHKDTNDSKISTNDKKNNLNNFFKNINPNNQQKNDDNPLELSLYKILGQDISYILNAGKCDISGLKENALIKMKNKEFEPGTQDINNITLPVKYNKGGRIGEIIEFFIDMKYDKKMKEISNKNKINVNLNKSKEHKNNDIIKEETKKEIEPSEEHSIIAKQEINTNENNIKSENITDLNNINTNNNNTNTNNNNLLQSNDDINENNVLEEIKETENNYTFEHIPIKICFIGTSFSGRKTQSLILHEKYPNIKIYNIESIIKDIVEIYNKINAPIEEPQTKGKQVKKINVDQIKQENEILKNENEFQLSIIEPIIQQNENKNIKTIIKEIPNEKLIDLILFYIKKDFPLKEKNQIEEEINQRKEKITNIDKELESMNVNEEQNKKAKINVKEKERLIKEKEQLINESYTGFIINDFPINLSQFKLIEKKCTGFIEELDKPKEEKDIEKEQLLFPLDKIYCPKNKIENIKSVFDKYCIFEISDDEILKRKNNRMIDETTGIIYHNEYNPPDEKDKKLIERLKPLTEPSDEEISKEIKKYYFDLIEIKEFIDLFKNIFQVQDLKDKNEENENIINNVLYKIMEDFDNKFIPNPNIKKVIDSGKLRKSMNPSEKNNTNNNTNIENKDSKDNNEQNTNENNISRANSIKNVSIHNNNMKKEKETSIGNISARNTRNGFILPVMLTSSNKFNKRYTETKKRLSLSNLDIHFLNKWNLFLSEYKFSILRNFVNIYNIKQLILDETIKVEEEYKLFLNLPSNKKEIIDRFTNKLSAFRSQFKDIKGHQLVIEEFHRDLTDLTNGIWDIINQRKQKAIEKREQIMTNGFFEKQIKHFYENIENLFIQETKKFLLSVNIIKEFYYGLQSEILKSVILPFTSQIENIDIKNIFKDTENLEIIITNDNGQLKFPKIEKMFLNCMKIIFYLDYAIRNVEDKLKGNIEDFKPGNKEASNSGTISIISKSRLTKKKRKKNKDVSISEESKEVFNFIDETNSAIEIEKYNYKYRLLSIKFYSIKFLTDLNNISNELFELLDTWIIDSVHYQNQMMNKLLERLSKIVDNTSLKIIWDFELDKYTLMKTKKFEFIDSYNLFLEDDNENDNKEIKYGKYMPILISLYNDINNFCLQNEFIDKNVLIDILLKKNISSIELKNTPIYKINFHMYQRIIDLLTIKNKNYIRKDLININHIFTILLLLPFPIVKEKEIDEIKDKVKDKLISKCYLKENDFKEIVLWFEKNNILKNDDDEDNGNNNLNLIKNFLCLLFNKNGNINFEDFINVISLNVFVENNKNFDKNKFKFYKDLFF